MLLSTQKSYILFLRIISQITKCQFVILVMVLRDVLGVINFLSTTLQSKTATLGYYRGTIFIFTSKFTTNLLFIYLYFFFTYLYFLVGQCVVSKPVHNLAQFHSEVNQFFLLFVQTSICLYPNNSKPQSFLFRLTLL